VEGLAGLATELSSLRDEVFGRGEYHISMMQSGSVVTF
jgi:hypothetical protein